MEDMAGPNQERRERRADPPGSHPPRAVDLSLKDVCNAPDPRAFLGALSALDHVIADPARTVFRAVINALRGQRGINRVSVLDLACAYGVNAALLRFGMTGADVFEHWGQRRLIEAEPEEVRDYDRRYFASLECAAHFTMTGLDPAPSAVDFARAVGLLEEAFGEDLEDAPASPALAEAVAATDLVLSTGWTGPARATALRRLLAPASDGAPPWVAWFQRRSVPVGPAAEALADSGLATETLEEMSFRERRFADDGERDAVLEALAALGRDATGKEEDGWLHAEFHLARPADEVDARPLPKLLASFMPR